MTKGQSSLTAIGAAVAVVAALLSAPIAAQAQGQGQGQGKDIARVIVAFKAGASAAVQDAVAKLGGGVVLDLDDSNAFAVSLPRGAVAALKANPSVRYVEDDPVRTIQGFRSSKARASGTPADTKVVPYGPSPQVVPYGITQVQADRVSGAPEWAPKICIIDSGIDATHEDLAGNTLSGINFTKSGTWDSDENAHGTHVAGTIAALNNTLGVVGVNGTKQVSLYIAKVFDATGSASSSVITKAINACGSANADIVSMSLGGAGASRTEQAALDSLWAKNVLLVAAAGNDGDATVSYPAGFANVMSVAANDEKKNWATFSQYNADVEISGPGVDVLSTIPPNIESLASASVAGTSYAVNPMSGSPRMNVSAPLADFGLGGAAVRRSMNGKVCLIARGTFSFADKVLNCQKSGGVGAIIYNNVDGELLGTLGDTATNIPSVGALLADGAQMLSALDQTASISVFPDPALYAQFSGTSMATPHVSAVAALVWSYYPTCTAEEIRTTLKLSALDIETRNWDEKTGAGLVQAKAAVDRIAKWGCGI
jgi:subtilisin family serine protease